MRTFLIPIVLIALAAGGLAVWLAVPGESPTQYRTETVARGPLTISVSATGVLEPEEVIDVGAQVAGLVSDFGVGADDKPIDYGSPVEPNTVLAKIDDAIYRARVEQGVAQVRSAEQQFQQAKAKVQEAMAAVEQAQANTERAEADLMQYEAKLAQAERDLTRAKALRSSNTITQQEYDNARTAVETGKATVAVAKAAIAQAKAMKSNSDAAVIGAEAAVGTAEAAVSVAKASLKQDEVNLSHCTIRSPVKGTIIDRRVTRGQTVQSSFNTPSLFLIAKDLTRMMVWASVSEADVTQIRIGQTAEFTVDSLPNETFRATVGRIRLNATNTQNVVVYTVELSTENPDRKLLPYMTANIRFEISRRENALLAPNAALRFRPAKAGDRKGPGRGGKSAEKERANAGALWVKEDGELLPISVQLGRSDGVNTEIIGGNIAEGAEVVVGEMASNSGGSGAGNPFVPKPFGGKKQ